MEDGDFVADICLVDVIPLIAMRLVDDPPKRTNVPIGSAEDVLLGADFL